MPQKICILGCGHSINDLTDEEKTFINHCDLRFALNKFAAFAHLAEIQPTHVWFTDSDVLPLQFVCDEMRKHELNDIHFFVCDPNKEPAERWLGQLLRMTTLRSRIYVRNQWVYKVLKRFLRSSVISNIARHTHVVRLPPGAKVTMLKVGQWPDSGPNSWAESLDQHLYMFKTSFTSLLNYLHICHPGSELYFAGTDFNSPGYFFADAIKDLEVDLSDWTTPIQVREKRHMALIDQDQCGTLPDRLGAIRKKLDEKDFECRCFCESSVLVETGFAKLFEQPETRSSVQDA